MLIQADAFHLPYADSIFHSCIFSPPYFGLRKYSGDQGEEPLGLEATPERHIERMVEVLREVWRVTRPDAVVWINYGDCYSGRTSDANSGTRDKQWWVDTARAGQMNITGSKATAHHPLSIQAGNLMLMPHRLAIALQADGWIVRNDLVWCLSGGAIVYARTQKGDIPMMIKDMVRLDPSTVQLWNGDKWTQVLGFSESPRPERPLEIVLKSGERIGCTPNHEWPTERGLLKASELKRGDVILKTSIPEPENPIAPKFIPDEFGWVVGIYLAEGSRSGNTLQIAGHIDESDRWNRLEKWAEEYGGSARLYQTSNDGMCMHIDSHPMRAAIDLYIAGKIARNKHLTTATWQRSNDFLGWVVRGYLDGDGHYDAKNDRYRLGFTNNDYLAQDLRTLSARLNMHLRLVRCKHTMGDRKFPGWRGTLRFQISHFNARIDNEIASIEKSRARRFYDVSVADEPHLFALASGVLTHNSKRNPMPESVAGWRWERNKKRIGHKDTVRKSATNMGSFNEIGGNVWERDALEPEYEYGDDYVLRKSSWRHTRAHEYVFQLVKKMGYYCNQEAVREVASYPNDDRGARADARRGTDMNSMSGKTGTGRNPRSVLGDHTPTLEAFHYWLMENFDFNLNDAVEQFKYEATNPADVLDVPTAPYKGQHFATFPPDLIAPLIRASVPRRCCPECGMGWAPVVETHYTPHWKGGSTGEGYHSDVTNPEGMEKKPRLQKNTITHSYRPTCEHEHTREEAKPGIVLDIFAGSGTVPMVANELGVRSVGMDISYPYLDEQARYRAKWGEQKTKTDDLPLFDGLEEGY